MCTADLAVAAAATAQIAWLMGLRAAPVAIGVGIVAAGAWRMRGRIPGLDVLLITASLGGLAMLVGGWAAAPFTSHHADGTGWTTVLLAFGPMVAICVGGCVAWCPPPCRARQRRARALAHGALAVGMVAGMGLGGAAVSAHASALAHHLGMLSGMVAGAAAALAIMYAVDAWRFR